MYQTWCQAKQIKIIIRPYTNHNIFLVQHATYQVSESLRAASFSKLDKTVNNSYIFNVKCVLYTIVGALPFWQLYLWIQQPLESPQNIRSRFSAIFPHHIPPLLIHKIILTIPTNTPFVYTDHFFASLFLPAAILAIYTKVIFLNSVLYPIKAASRDQGARESFEEWDCFNWHCFNLSLLL